MTEYAPPESDSPPPEPSPPPGPPQSMTGTFLNVAAGAVGILIVHLVVTGLLYVAWTIGTSISILRDVFEAMWIAWFMGMPLLQLLYVIPAAIFAWRIRKPLGQGIVLGALLTLLLYTACWGIVVLGLPDLH